METNYIIINFCVSILAGLGAGAGLFYILGEQWIKNKFTKSIETYKAELDRKNREIQSSLDLQLDRMRIRFGELHKERINVIRKLYLMINHLNTSVAYLALPDELLLAKKIDANELITKIQLNHHTIVQYLSDNQIYLPQSLVDRIAGMGYTLNSVAKYFQQHGKNASKEHIIEMNEKSIRPLLNALRDEFREVLGVEKK
ncbi:hypothetical protein SAMN05444145_1143 [Alistipes timonensis JC136]|uniref:Uncharacterized protein n=1 Tax=Alistipes timonensis JC136 TaxID=1033731 RepID=A0A1H4FXR8_9BACT|nr:hypothetical protein [Alistipes timonensis]SEB02143.1 hypothetical protein SAMN05444145_1143 [Alistipes timonensis JC136]